MENESVLAQQSPPQGEPDSMDTIDFAPHNPLCVTPPHNLAYPLISNSRPDHTAELSATMPREMWHNFEYKYEGTSGTTYDFQGYHRENQLGEEFGSNIRAFEDQWGIH